jgi:hypothetical protein
MQINRVVNEKPKEKIFFCWNNTGHPETYSEYKFSKIYNRNEIVSCPVCGQCHKITMRMGED